MVVYQETKLLPDGFIVTKGDISFNKNNIIYYMKQENEYKGQYITFYDSGNCNFKIKLFDYKDFPYSVQNYLRGGNKNVY